MMPSLVKGDDVRSTTKANARHGRLRVARESMGVFYFCFGTLLHFSLMQMSVLDNGISGHCGALGQILFKPDILDLCFTWVLTS